MIIKMQGVPDSLVMEGRRIDFKPVLKFAEQMKGTYLGSHTWGNCEKHGYGRWVDKQCVGCFNEVELVVIKRKMREIMPKSEVKHLLSVVACVAVGGVLAIPFIGDIALAAPIGVGIDPTPAVSVMAPATEKTTAEGLKALIIAYLSIVDYLAWGVFAFSGTAWLFGHRAVAIERMIGGASGFLIILHAWDIVKFLKGLI